MTKEQALSIINDELFGVDKPRHSTEDRLEALSLVRSILNLSSDVLYVDPEPYGSPLGSVWKVSFRVTPSNFPTLTLLCKENLNK